MTDQERPGEGHPAKETLFQGGNPRIPTMQRRLKRHDIGEMIADRYRVVDFLGEGGFGAVYRVEDTLIGGMLACKEMDYVCGDDPNAPSRTEMVEGFRREAKILHELRHTNIPRAIYIVTPVSIYFCPKCAQLDRPICPSCEEGGPLPLHITERHYLLMDYIAGETLEERAQAGPLSEHQIVAWGIEICDALSLVHTRGLIHRDIKAENIVIDEKTHRAFLVDFGAARYDVDPRTSNAPIGKYQTRLLPSSHTATLGTYGYAPPEQVAGKPELRSDLYALGMTLYRLATGLDPRDPGELLEMRNHPPKAFNPDLSDAFSKVVVKATREVLSERFASAAEMASALREIVEPPPPEPREEVARQDVGVPLPPSGEQIVCRHCGTVHTGSARYCQQCGFALFRSCPHCGTVLPLTSRYCTGCRADMLSDRTLQIYSARGGSGRITPGGRSSGPMAPGGRTPGGLTPAALTPASLTPAALTPGRLSGRPSSGHLSAGARRRITSDPLQPLTLPPLSLEEDAPTIPFLLKVLLFLAAALGVVWILLVPLHPDRIASRHLRKGIALKEAGRYARAEEELRKALEGNLTRAEAYEALGYIKLDTGAFDDAISNFQEALLNAPRASTYVGLGKAYFEKGEFSNAVAKLREALRLEPNAEIAELLGDVHQAEGKIDQAIEYYRQAISLGNAPRNAMIQLASLYERKGWRIFARKAYEDYLEVYPTDITVHRSLGRLLFEMEDYAAAAEVFQRASALAPFDPELKRFLAKAEFQLGRYEEALATWQDIRELAPRDPEVYLNLGLCYRTMNDYDRAIEHFLQALRLDPTYERALFAVGLTYRLRGDLSEAWDAYRKLKALNPRSATLLFDGLSGREIGKRKERMSVQADPSSYR
ncbi:MAG: tetratricopeptide repeat protein [Deltaproteobacteria bacterium]|nr:MAG: tetratricopeptide repeat protein [Deltaproteobacteria bacterium]